MSWVIGALVVVLSAVVVVLRRRPHHEPGIANFRRHIDALSPEARREVIDRVRPRPVGPAEPTAETGVTPTADHDDRHDGSDGPADGRD